MPVNPANVRITFLVCLLMVLATTAAFGQSYTVTDLGLLSGDSSSWGMFINSSGDVSGCSDTSNSITNVCNWISPGSAFFWSSSGGMQPIEPLPGDDFSTGFFISDSKQVVGSSCNLSDCIGHGFLWTYSTNQTIDLGTLKGGNYSDADQINSKGIIVGESAVNNGVDGVLWTPIGNGKYQIHDIGFLAGAPYTYPYSINNKNQVVGNAYFNNVIYHACIWGKTTGWKDLGTLSGGTVSLADWINDDGVSVGQSNSIKYPNGVAILWLPSGKIHIIGTLPGGTSSFGGYISDTNVVVGESTIANGDTHAFIWSQAKGMQDLNNLIPQNSGWDLNHASAMNSLGQIVGFGTVNGSIHGYMLTP
jgi:probable HAF family extracellular repeat protein